MRALVLSDIHSNLEALEAVLRHAAGSYDTVWNLGDTVGYGASPNEVVAHIRDVAALHVRGNHDRVAAATAVPVGFNPIARAAALWTRKALTPEHLEWLRSVPKGPLHPDGLANGLAVVCAHGSPLNEDQYILSMRDAWAPLQRMGTAVTFIGHTHIQGGFSQREQDWFEVRPTIPAGNGPAQWTLALAPDTRHLVNPGSVGQPRDCDWRAAYAIYDADASQIVYHRVPYDVTTAQGRILMAGLPERLAARLREGR